MRAVGAAVLLGALAAGGARAQEAAPADTAVERRRPDARIYWRPVASLLVPGAGQLMAGQDRGAVYLAAEVYLLSRFLQLNSEADRETQRFQALAYEIARRPFAPTRRDTVFEYYEQMERFVESGRFDVDPGPAFSPETDASTYNGSVWLLARRTFWEDPDVPPDPTSPQYWGAIEFYQARAVGPNFRWSWREHSPEHQVFRETIRKSDVAFRRAQNQVGLLLANHLVSVVDALISTRMSAAVGRPTAVRTTMGRAGHARVSVTVAF